MSTAPAEVGGLVERFGRNLSDYKGGAYNEAQVRREFIDPLFKSLGWDVDNEQGYAEAYKAVIHEDAIKVGGASKAPDYCFRIGGVRKFFLEAKRPAVPLKEHAESAFQLRRYAWSARLSLSVLTDFEELAVYDCRVRPHKNDRSSTARTMYFTYDEYLDRWDELASVFSREAVLKGSFDRYAESSRRKRGTAEVDVEFLKAIEGWREALARNFALRNPGLSDRELNFAVQRTIDRIIFLRMCEDRGIEHYGQLQGLCGGASIYPRLGQLFRQADDRYNSSLFYFTAEPGREPADELTLGLNLDDRAPREILRSLYYPESPYEFSVLPPEILGQVYEQFLGKVIRLTKGHRAKVEEKPEVRKAGGVYYTPTYIVDYIVKHTVGKLLEGKTPAEVGPDPPKRSRRRRTGPGPSGRGKSSRRRPLPHGRGTDRPLRVLDPACGSGSFLLGAYQYLLNWHRDWYVEDGPAKHTDRIYQGAGGQWHLTIGEKKRILLNNIYGVDIDPQAVEVTKLSLLLKVLEGETSETVGQTLRLFHERALPDLGENIKCGNSLIGPDFYDNRQLELLDEEERYRINAFDWQAEFPAVFEPNRARQEGARAGRRSDRPLPHGRGSDQQRDPTVGFDAVIGNPPYLKEYTHRLPFEYLRSTRLRRYYQGKMDLWYAFACWSIDLLRVGGLHSFIATNNWVTSTGASLLREKLRRESRIIEFTDFGDYRVFRGVGIQTMIYVVEKTASGHSGTTLYRRLDNSRASQHAAEDFLFCRSAAPQHTSFGAAVPADDEGAAINFVHESESSLLAKIQSAGTDHLRKTELTQGIVAPQDCVTEKHVQRLRVPNIKRGDGIFVLRDEQVECLRIPPKERDILKPYYTTAELHRFYGSPENRHWVIYTTSDANQWIDRYPRIRAHLQRFAPVITSHNGPYGLHRSRNEQFFVGRKIVSLRKTRRPCFTLTSFPCYVSQTFNVVKTERFRPEFLIGVLNSSLATFWLSRRGKKQGDLLQVDTGPLLSFPICPGHDTKGDPLVTSVQQMLDLHKQLAAAKTAHDKEVLQRQIDATDRQIDRLVYELYGLSEEEIGIVEEATS